MDSICTPIDSTDRLVTKPRNTALWLQNLQAYFFHNSYLPDSSLFSPLRRRCLCTGRRHSAHQTPDAAEAFRLSCGSDMGRMRASPWYGWPAKRVHGRRQNSI